MTVNGLRIPVPRYLVVATCANPNAVLARTRRIQVRAWNSAEEVAHRTLPREAVAEIAAAHLFGFFRSLKLGDNARALALSVQIRAEGRRGSVFESNVERLNEVSNLADAELLVPAKNDQAVVVPIEMDFGKIEVEIAAPTISLVRKLQTCPG